MVCPFNAVAMVWSISYLGTPPRKMLARLANLWKMGSGTDVVLRPFGGCACVTTLEESLMLHYLLVPVLRSEGDLPQVAFKHQTCDSWTLLSISSLAKQ